MRGFIAALGILAAACGRTADRGLGPVADLQEDQPPEVARVVCRGESTIVETPRVRAQPDGVHVQVRNETAEPLYVVAIHGLPDTDAEPGQEELVGPIPPGDARIACYAPLDAPHPKPHEWQPITVVDPDGHWRSPELECVDDTAGSLSVDYIPGPAGAHDDPIEAARERLTVRPADVVERARYPEEKGYAAVRVVRDGRVIATALFSHLELGWFFDGGDFCSGEIRPTN